VAAWRTASDLESPAACERHPLYAGKPLKGAEALPIIDIFLNLLQGTTTRRAADKNRCKIKLAACPAVTPYTKFRGSGIHLIN